jgi:hypothetical protein
MKKPIWLLVLLVLMTVPSAFAQVDSKPIVGHFAFGWVEPQDKAADVVEPGWNFSGGATWKHPAKPLGLRLDFGYNWFYATKQTLESANGDGLVTRIDDGFASMTTLNLDVVWDFSHGKKIGGYFGVGPGMYSRYWQLTFEALTSGIWCDPWTGWCYPITTVGNVIAENDRLTKIGANVVAAMTFRLPSGSQMYLEVNYNWMDTSPEKTIYMPILLGWRW